MNLTALHRKIMLNKFGRSEGSEMIGYQKSVKLMMEPCHNSPIRIFLNGEEIPSDKVLVRGSTVIPLMIMHKNDVFMVRYIPRI